MDKPIKFTKRLALQIGLAVVIIIPITVAFLLLKSYIAESAKEIKQTRQDIVEKTQSLNALVTLRRQYNEYGKDYITIMQNVIPEKDKLINLSQEIQTLANSENLEFGFSFMGEKQAEGEELGFIEFGLSIGGEDMDQISDFLEKLETFRYLTSISKLKISRGSTKISAGIEGKVYYR